MTFAGAALLALLAPVDPAPAAERWTVSPFGAIAYAPPPVAARGVEAVQLDCRQQRWTLLLRVAADTDTQALPDTARLRIDRSDFELTRLSSERGVALKVPRELLDPLKSGGEMSVEVGEGLTVVQARLSLRGSRKAIEAVAPECSPRDMSAYEAITLEQTGEAVDTATKLLADEIARFRAAAGFAPQVQARRVDLDVQRALLVASLCGASSYFGDTGCNVTVHARSDAMTDWREVFNSEGVALHWDADAAIDGWPNLVTLPPGEDDEFVWFWDGGGYALQVPPDLRAAD
ncbi:hypothetical protein GN330_04180 [Nitratireductor sp. CAU 1489]|uniref:Uncharacterized protein n=1 Tax=Nitratireductor arenosus TaxID=2682096 RepID=A0A844QEC6_9HYPH|nr:hypothetical protein [Nitratireductor arenosus]MVA96443.1 hypothetical protein [Nitratireductor arenosus]